MKAKRFLSLLLSLSLAVSLAAPALAAESAPLPPGVTAAEAVELMAELGGLSAYYDLFTLDFARRYKEAHPEEYQAFDPDAWFAQEWDFYGSKEEYLADRDLTEELFREDMWVEYVTYTEEYAVAFEEYMAQEQTRRWRGIGPPTPGSWRGWTSRPC